MFKKRKAQADAGNAATLVIIIGAILMLYILFIPQSEREKLLGTSVKPTNASLLPPAAEDIGRTLLLENPGTIRVLKESRIEHNLGSINLFTKTEDQLLKSIDSAYVETSRDKETTKKVVLIVNEPLNTKNAKLSFSVGKHSGKLIILVNDNEVYNNEVKSQTEPVSLGQLEKDNVIEFKSSSVGWNFFGKNYYELSGINVIATVTDVSGREAKITFLVSDDEAANIETARISYFVDCTQNLVGKLNVALNSVLLSSKSPDCGSKDVVSIGKNDIKSGRNELLLVSEKGSMLLDRIVAVTDLKEPIFPIYYFEINSTHLKFITNGTFKPAVSLKFVDDKTRKVATLNINGHNTGIDTTKASFSKNIEPFIIEGNNYVRIVPETTLNVVEIKVRLELE